MNGERFYLLQDESALKQHDETYLFKVGIDGDKLAGDLDKALELLSKESAKVDVNADTCSPDRSERDSDRLGLKALSLKKVFEVVPAFVPEADDARHGATWRHSVRDGTENWMQLE